MLLEIVDKDICIGILVKLQLLVKRHIDKFAKSVIIFIQFIFSGRTCDEMGKLSLPKDTLRSLTNCSREELERV